MSKHSITAVFDTRAHAEQAMAQLKSSGISASDITLLPASGEAVSTTQTGQGFWASLEQLFGGTPDYATYAESIRRGGIMLSVRAEDDRLDDVVDILEQHGSVDLDEREASWRSSGWTGDAPVSGASTTTSSPAMAGSRGLGMNDPGMTSMSDASGSRMGTGALGAGVLGAGAGALGTTAYEERRDTSTPIQPVAERPTLVADRTTVPASARGGDDTIKVYEERLDVGKRSVSRGKVRVHTHVESREVSEDVTLHSEVVSVDRRAVDRPVSAAAFDVDPFKERTIEMEEFAEEAVVAKSAHVVEEIGIRKEGTDRVESVHETPSQDGGRHRGRAHGWPCCRISGPLRPRDPGRHGGGRLGWAHVGIVDHMDGGRIKLKKADVASGGEHHYLTHDMVQSVAGKVMLAVTAAEAKARWATA